MDPGECSDPKVLLVSVLRLLRLSDSAMPTVEPSERPAVRSTSPSLRRSSTRSRPSASPSSATRSVYCRFAYTDRAKFHLVSLSYR